MLFCHHDFKVFYNYSKLFRQSNECIIIQRLLDVFLGISWLLLYCLIFSLLFSVDNNSYFLRICISFKCARESNRSHRRKKRQQQKIGTPINNEMKKNMIKLELKMNVFLLAVVEEYINLGCWTLMMLQTSWTCKLS